jgi:hypothetical protein
MASEEVGGVSGVNAQELNWHLVLCIVCDGMAE